MASAEWLCACTAHTLAHRLPPLPQLIVLAACQSAQQTQTEALSGLGLKLVPLGMPVVVAMHDTITVLTARQFGVKFDRHLLERGTIDRAMNEARSLLITNRRLDVTRDVGRLNEAVH